MDQKIIILSLIILASISLILFSILNIFNSTGKIDLTGNIVLDTKENFKQGDKLEGILTINIDEETDKTAPILVSIIKNSKVIALETFSVEEIMQKSQKIGQSYNLNIGNLINYTFEENGEYEFSFLALSLDINFEQAFTVN